MGSLRNPVGPLPPSIYWRRRGVALALLLVVGLLIYLAVSSGGGGGGGKSDNGKGPAPSITPGPSSSGPAISERPGGRDTGGGSGGGGTGGGGTGGGETGGTGGGSGGSDGGPGGGSAGGSAGGDVGFEVGNDGVPAGSSMPDCDSSAVTMRLRSVKDTYRPGEIPKFELTAENSAGSACKLDFGPEAAVITVKSASDDHVWATDDCPWTRNPVLLQVPADGRTARSVTWDRTPSAPHCATPKGGPVGTGKFTATLKADGLPAVKTEFTLAKA